jgi:hypothetical protein
MDSLYKLFALAWVAERKAYDLVKQWETLQAAQGKPEPSYTTDSVYKSLIDQWDEAHTELKDVEKQLLKATFSVLSSQ